MGLIKTLFTQAFPPALKGYYDSLISNLTVDTTNTASAATDVEINGNSGVATFTQSIPDGDSGAFSISNENVSTTSIVAYGMINNSEVANLVCARFSVLSESLVFVITNNSGFASDEPIKIWFQILNP